MTTTKIRLDPAIKTTIDAVKRAHAKAKAQGTFLALLPDSGQYFVQTSNGAVKHRYTEHKQTLTVYASGIKTTVNLSKDLK